MHDIRPKRGGTCLPKERTCPAPGRLLPSSVGAPLECWRVRQSLESVRQSLESVRQSLESVRQSLRQSGASAEALESRAPVWRHD